MTKVLNGKTWIFVLAGLLLMGSLLAGCDEDNDSNGSDATVSILARGGAGITGNGGPGGIVVAQASLPGGELNILPGGAVNGKFLMPGPVDVDLGPEPWAVGRNTTVEVYLNPADADANAAVGEHLTLLDDATLYRKDGVGDYAVISGLKVRDGVVLTLALNVDDAGQTGEDMAELDFSDDVVIDGAIRVMSLDTGDLAGVVELRDGAPATDRDMGLIYIMCLNFILNGRIDAAGLDADVAGDRGGFGGGIYIVAMGEARLAGRIDLSGGDGLDGGDGGDAGWDADSNVGLNVLVNTFGNVVNRARINARGGDGADGGNATVVAFIVVGDIFNAGAIDADGGNGENGDGGNGGVCTLASNIGAVKNQGDISARGGAAVEDGVGGPVQAGTGGTVQIVSISDIINTGAIELGGGDAAVDGVGGPGGTLVMQIGAPSGRLSQQGKILTDGGESEGVGNIGGSGGAVMLIAPQSTVRVKGKIDVSGGSGDIGGQANVVQIIGGPEASLLGYDGGIKAEGGDGAMGGPGGMVQFIAPNGNLTSRVSFFADAGESDVAAGPPGGVLVLVGRYVNQQGEVSLLGSDAGNGSASGGGQVQVTAIEDISFQGRVAIAGGMASGAGNFNGGNGGVFVLTGKNVKMAGKVLGSGGMGVGTGIGGAGGVANLIAAEQVVSQADYLVSGGDGDATVGFGGDGGAIVLDSDLATPTVHHGVLEAVAGDGSVAGTDGTVTIDGVVVFP